MMRLLSLLLALALLCCALPAGLAEAAEEAPVSAALENGVPELDAFELEDDAIGSAFELDGAIEPDAIEPDAFEPEDDAADTENGLALDAPLPVAAEAFELDVEAEEDAPSDEINDALPDDMGDPLPDNTDDALPAGTGETLATYADAAPPDDMGDPLPDGATLDLPEAGALPEYDDDPLPLLAADGDLIPIDADAFPDDAFRAWVSANADPDRDSCLSGTERLAVSTMGVDNKGIASLRGIEFFPGLTALYCDGNRLTELDLSGNPKLRWLSCRDNQLAGLTPGLNPALMILDVSGNLLSGLDLSANTRLMELVCQGNRLAALDLSANTRLTNVNCADNQLTRLDLCHGGSLSQLVCDGNQLTELDLSGLDRLLAASCADNRLAVLDLRGDAELINLFCADNRLAALDLSGCAALSCLYAHGNLLAALDVSACPALVRCVSGRRSAPGYDRYADVDGSGRTVAVLSVDYGVSPIAHAAGLVLGANEITLGVKETWSLVAANSGIAAADCAFSVSKKGVISVSAAGVVKGLKAGSAVITAAPKDGGAPVSCAVTVKKAPSKVALSAARLTMGTGEIRRLEAALPAKTGSRLTWTSSNPAVAGVRDGELVAYIPGTTTITVRTFNKKTAKCAVTVRMYPTGMTLDADSVTLGIRESRTLSPVFYPSTSGGGVRYAMEDPAVAAVDGDGRLTGLAPGTTTLVAESFNGHRAEASVTVLPAPGSVSLAAKSLTLGVGESFTLEPMLPEGTHAGLSYKSGKPKVAAVGADGTITAKKTGTAKITVTTHNGKKAACTVTVKKRPTGMKLGEAAVTLGVGQVYSPAAAFTPKDAGCALRWTSSDEAVVSAAGGRIVAVAPGEATLTAAAYSGLSAEVAVSVLPAPDEVRLPAGIKLGLKEKLTLTPDIDEGTHAAFSYTSSKKKVAPVSAAGVVTAKKTGSANITVTAHNGPAATARVTVYKLPSKITLNAKTLPMTAGETFQLEVGYPKNTYARVAFTSSNPAVAAVDADGVVRALAEGVSTITAKSSNKKTAKCVVTVDGANPQTVIDTMSRDMGAVTAPYLDDNGCVPFDRVSEAITAMSEYISEARDKGWVQRYHVQNTSIWYVDAFYGYHWEWALPLEGIMSGGTQAEMSILRFEQVDEFLNLTKRTEQSITGALEYYSGARPSQQSDFTLPALQSIGANQIVLIAAHGGYNEAEGYSHFCTGIHLSSSDMYRDNPLFQPGVFGEWPACVIRGVGLSAELADWYVCVTPVYIDEFCTNRMDNSIIWLGDCESGNSDALAQSFLRKGAAIVVAYENEMDSDYHEKLCKDTFDNMLTIDSATGHHTTFSKAFEKAKGSAKLHFSTVHHLVLDWAVELFKGDINNPKVWYGENGENHSLYHAQLTGTAYRREDGERIPLAGVEIRCIQNGGTLVSATTDSQGKYSIGLPAGTYSVLAESGSYGAKTAGVTVTAEATTIMNWNFAPGTLCGTVTDGRSGKALAGATVICTAPDGATLTATTDEAGAYRFLLDPGTYAVSAAMDDHEAQTATVRVEESAALTLDFTLLVAPGELRGTVVHSALGTPIPGADIACVDAQGHRTTATTDSAGGFALALDPGAYAVTVSKDGCEDSASLVIHGNEGTVHTFSLDLPYAEISGSVTDRDGAALAGATITCTAADGTKTAIPTDALGHYTATLSPGAWTIEAAADGYRSQSVSVTLADHQGAVQDFALEALNGTIAFGCCEQDNDKTDGKEPIEWLVLKREGSRALVLSKYGLNYREYNRTYDDVTWETCTLRAWLNDTFLNDAFTADEQARIVTADVSTAGFDPGNESGYSEGGNDTHDEVFLLSREEVLELVPESEWALPISEYALIYSEGTGNYGERVWWLRSPGRWQENACVVNGDRGAAYIYMEENVNRLRYVRPAMWIELDP